MVIKRGEIWWATLPPPRGSEPGYRRPVLVIQSDVFNRSAIGTVIVAVITSNTGRAAAPSNVLLYRRESRLARNSVVNTSQLVTLSREFFTERVSHISSRLVEEVEAGLRKILAL